MTNTSLKMALLVSTIYSQAALAITHPGADFQFNDDSAKIAAIINSTHLTSGEYGPAAKYSVNVDIVPERYNSYFNAPSYGQRFASEISANLGQQHSRWFWNATASTTLSSRGHLPNDHVNFESNAHHRQTYFNFSDSVWSIPVLAPALEKSINKAVHRRLKKVSEYYARIDDLHRLQDFEKQVSQIDGYGDRYQPVMSDEMYQARYDLGYFKSTFHNLNGAPSYGMDSFNHSLHNDMDSVLAHFRAARQAPGVKIRGELGYSSDKFEWRMGHQKQKTSGDNVSDKRQIRTSNYSTMNWNISDRMNYFNFITDETFENNFGVDGFDRETKSSYHRLGYALNDETSIFIGGGKHKDGIIGKTKYFHAGAQNCSTLANAWHMCSSLSYEDSEYDFTHNDFNDIGHKSGIRATLTARLEF